MTERALVLNNRLVSLAFDKDSGALTSIRNLATGGEYLKEAAADGNPFRAYVDTTEVPQVLQLAFPWPVQPVEGAMGGQLVDPRSCRLIEHRFDRSDGAGQLRLVSRHANPELTFELTVQLPDDDVATDFDLVVRNHGTQARRVMVAVPYLTGLALGSSGSSNQGVRLVGFGQARSSVGELRRPLWSYLVRAVECRVRSERK